MELAAQLLVGKMLSSGSSIVDLSLVRVSYNHFLLRHNELEQSTYPGFIVGSEIARGYYFGELEWHSALHGTTHDSSPIDQNEVELF